MINRVLNDRYEILEAIGEGPALAAFRARDRALNRIVTLKTPVPALAGRDDVAERLRQSLANVLSLSHVGITRAFDVGTDAANQAAFFLAEEYVRGIDLKERIRRVAPFSLSAATDVAVTLAEALEFAHARGVFHGDVRPQNVLIGPEGQVKLTGFGVAAAAHAALMTDPALLLRLAPYTAPDIADTRIPTAPGDLYALGIVLFEMLTGDLPYNGDGPIQIALRHAQEPIPSPRSLNPGVPRALEGIVMKALGKRPQDRYASAAEMLQDLRTVRDALRYGKSLAWSPLDRIPEEPAAAAVPLVAAAAPLLPREDATIIAPRSVVGADLAAEDGTLVMPSRPLLAPPSAAPPRVGTAPPPAGPAAARPAEDWENALPPSPPPRSGNRWLTALNLFLTIVILGALATLAFLTIYFVRPASEVIVPNLMGKSFTDAQALAAAQKFEIAKVDEQFRDKEPMGIIYQMRPEAGRHIREGKTVSVWVSKGPKLVEIPDVRDMSFERARQMLGRSGLRLGEYRGEYDPLAAKGNVLRQMPEPGENRPRGTRIDLVLSKGEEPPPPPIEPILPDPVTPAPSDETGETTTTTLSGAGDEENRVRVFTVDYRIAKDNVPHRIRIDLTDRDGTRTVYDETRDAGERVLEDVEGVGRRVTIRVYDNDQMQREVTP